MHFTVEMSPSGDMISVFPKIRFPLKVDPSYSLPSFMTLIIMITAVLIVRICMGNCRWPVPWWWADGHPNIYPSAVSLLVCVYHNFEHQVCAWRPFLLTLSTLHFSLSIALLDIQTFLFMIKSCKAINNLNGNFFMPQCNLEFHEL